MKSLQDSNDELARSKNGKEMEDADSSAGVQISCLKEEVKRLREETERLKQPVDKDMVDVDTTMEAQVAKLTQENERLRQTADHLLQHNVQLSHVDHRKDFLLQNAKEEISCLEQQIMVLQEA